MSLSDRIRPDCEAAPWVIKEVKQLETELAAFKENNRELIASNNAACAERNIAVTRVASILWSGVLDKHTCSEVQQWVTDYTAELAALREDCERLEYILNLFATTRAAIDAAMKEASK